MKGKFSRYLHTLCHLKPVQIRYQLWYRLRNRLLPIQYAEYSDKLSFLKVRLYSFPAQYRNYRGDGQFQFLNQEKTFNDEIDWNYDGYGKLWTYHLNYFDFHHQPDMDYQKGLRLINSFLSELKSRRDGFEPYPISLRTINWIKFLAVHQKYPEAVIRSLNAHYLILLRKLEYHLLGNHLLENAFSLLFGAVFFQNERLTKHARKILNRELREQILEDGAHFELSPMYHLILLQRALDGYNLLKNNDHELQDIEKQLEETIQKMVNWLVAMMFGNGDLPMFNDSTRGQALEPSVIINYARQLGFTPQKAKLSDSGYRRLKSKSFDLIADVGKVGPSYQPGHAHSDTLSFVLYHNDEPIIVDRGISTYEKNKLRDEERGTASHNTVIINNEEQTDVWGGFRVGRRAIPKIQLDLPHELSASHNGYKEIGCIHTRSWIVEDDDVSILDEIDGEAKLVVGHLHLHPSVTVEHLSENTLKIRSVKLNINGAYHIALDKYKFCNAFNKTEFATKIRICFNRRVQMRFIECV